MRGVDITQEELFSYRTLEERIPTSHPIRQLRKVVDCYRRTSTGLVFARRQHSPSSATNGRPRSWS